MEFIFEEIENFSKYLNRRILNVLVGELGGGRDFKGRCLWGYCCNLGVI